MVPKLLSIIVPCYNISEEDALIAIANMRSYFENQMVDFEIIISQNGNQNKFKFRENKTKLVFTKKKGLGIAIKNGLLAAKGEYFYFLPPDIPFGYTDYVEMYPLREKYDLIVGSKLYPKSIYKTIFIRKILSSIQRVFTIILLRNFPVKDPNGTLFGKTSKFIKLLPNI